MKIIIFLFFFISQVLFSQDMRIEVRAFKRKPDIYREYLLEIKFINASNDDYIIPIDTTGYRTYMPGNTCEDFFLSRNYPDLGFVPKIKHEEDFMDSFQTYPLPINPKDVSFYERKKKQEENKEKKLIKFWKKEHNLRNFDDQEILKNYHVYTNIKVIKAGTSIIFMKKFNPIKMNEDKFYEIYDYYYPIKSNEKYKMLLEYCIDEAKYNYLTPQQKEKYKDYKFFIGKIISNEVEI